MAIPSALNDLQVASYVETPASSGTTAVRYANPMVSYTGTINVGSGKTAGTLTSVLSGLVYKVTQGVGTLAGTPGTVTTILKDTLGGTMASLPTLAESGTAATGTIVPIDTGCSWIATTTGDPDGTQVAAAGVNVVLQIHYLS